MMKKLLDVLISYEDRRETLVHVSHSALQDLKNTQWGKAKAMCKYEDRRNWQNSSRDGRSVGSSVTKGDFLSSNPFEVHMQ